MYLRPHCQVNNSYVNNVTSVNLRQTGHNFIYLLNNFIEPIFEMVKTDSVQILDKILDSETFTNKEVLKGLLRFLYTSTKEGRVLRECDIAIDYFRRGDDFLPGDDTIVRVNIYKLRSLLEKYYQSEGRKDELVFEIPKGSYSLQIIKKGQVKKQDIRNPKGRGIIIVVLVASVLLNLFFYLKSQKVFYRDNPVWNDYIKDGLPVYITMGNPYFFRAKDSTVENIIVRDISINSEEDLHKSKLPLVAGSGFAVSELEYPYFSNNNVMPLPDIISVFSKAGVDVRLQALSSLNTEDLKRNNEIFIANINSFGFVNRFLEQTSIRLQTNPRQIIIEQAEDSTVLSVPEYIQGYYTDYAFLVKIPGPNNNFLSFMGDFHASGIKGLSNYITNEESLKELKAKIQKEYGRFPAYFEMVVKVTSYNYADFKTEVIYFKPLKL